MERKKFTAELNLKSMKYLTMMIVTKFMILAIFMIVLGFAVYSHYHTFSFFAEGIRSGRVFTPALITLLMGVFLLIVTFFGFFGVLKQSTCLVNVYALILGLMIIVKVVVVVLSFTLDPQTLRNALYIPISQFTSDREYEMEINRLQENLNCCGNESFLDYVGMEFNSNQATAVVRAVYQDRIVNVTVPATCCSSLSGEICASVRRQGCKSALINTVAQHAGVIGVLGICVTIMKVLGVIFALLLAKCIRRAKSERGLTSWTITERAIAARNESVVLPDHQPTNPSDNQQGNVRARAIPTATHVNVFP